MREVEQASDPEAKDSEAGEPPRQLGFLTAFSLVVASMVGTGVFTTTGLLTKDVPSPTGILLCWTVGGLAALCGAFAYAELGAAFPHSGGEYQFLARLMHPAVGFLSAFVSLIVGFAAPLAAIALAFGQYLTAMGVPVDPRLSGGALVVGLSVLNAWRVSAGAKFQNVFTLGKLLVIAAFVLFGLPRGTWANLDVGPGLAAVVPTPGFAVGLLWVSFAYTGWNAAAYVAGEVAEPAKVLPRALVLGTLVVTALYVALNLVFLVGAPFDALAGQVAVGTVAAKHLFGAAGGQVLSGIIALGLVSTVGAVLVTGPRIYEAVGKDVPRLAFLARRSPQGGPVYGVALQAALALVMMLTASFDQLLIYIGFTLSIFGALAVACVFILRRRGIAMPYRMPAFPLPPLVFLALMLWMIVSGIVERPVAAAFGAGTLVLGLVAYALAGGAPVVARPAEVIDATKPPAGGLD
ncbi:MAG: amino acid permease [Polyangiaceae bacterium]